MEIRKVEGPWLIWTWEKTDKGTRRKSRHKMQRRSINLMQ